MEILEKVDLSSKSVLVRLDLDVPIRNGQIIDDTRLVEGEPVLRFLLERGARITIIGHLGRPALTRRSGPEGREVPAFRIEPVRVWLQERFPKVIVLENLRFDPGEAQNSLFYAQDIVRHSQAEFYVFDAFAVSHREHASVIQIPKLLPTAMGFRMRDELEALGKVLDAPKRPLVFILGGAKPETKLPLVSKLLAVADAILVGGTLPLALSDHGDIVDNSKIHVATLAPDRRDISQDSAQEFSQKIMEAGTVVWNGPMGRFEESINALTHQSINESDVRTTLAWNVCGRQGGQRLPCLHSHRGRRH